jgi:hypothetical protein
MSVESESFKGRLLRATKLSNDDRQIKAEKKTKATKGKANMLLSIILLLADRVFSLVSDSIVSVSPAPCMLLPMSPSNYWYLSFTPFMFFV